MATQQASYLFDTRYYGITKVLHAPCNTKIRLKHIIKRVFVYGITVLHGFCIRLCKALQSNRKHKRLNFNTLSIPFYPACGAVKYEYSVNSCNTVIPIVNTLITNTIQSFTYYIHLCNTCNTVILPIIKEMLK